MAEKEKEKKARKVKEKQYHLTSCMTSVSFLKKNTIKFKKRKMSRKEQKNKMRENGKNDFKSHNNVDIKHNKDKNNRNETKRRKYQLAGQTMRDMEERTYEYKRT